MPDSTQPKTPTVEPHTESSPKESIRVAQEEFVGDEATPSRDRSEVSGAESADAGVEDGQLPGADQGARSSDRAVEDASLSNRMMAEAAGTESADPDGGDDEEGLEDDDALDDEDDLGDDEDEELDEADAEEELTDDETEATPGAMRAFAGV